MNTNKLKRKIMIRIYALFIIRRLKQPVILEGVVFVLSFLSLVPMVSLGHVLANTPHSVWGVYHFLIAAFVNTELLVKAMIFVMALVALVLTKNLADRIRAIKNKILVQV